MRVWLSPTFTTISLDILCRVGAYPSKHRSAGGGPSAQPRRSLSNNQEGGADRLFRLFGEKRRTRQEDAGGAAPLCEAPPYSCSDASVLRHAVTHEHWVRMWWSGCRKTVMERGRMEEGPRVCRAERSAPAAGEESPPVGCLPLFRGRMDSKMMPRSLFSDPERFRDATIADSDNRRKRHPGTREGVFASVESHRRY